MRRLSGILLCALGVAALASAQTPEELVARNIQAKGGIEKIKAIKTLRMTGRLQQGDFTATVSQEAKAPDLLRLSFTIQNMTQVQAYDGTTGWQISPFGGRRDPERLGEDDLRDLVEQADFYGPLIDYQEKGNRIESLGSTVVDGDEAVRLKVTLKNGDIFYYDLDPDTWLEIQVERQQFIRGSVRESVTELGSYKLVNGVYYPFSIRSGPKRNPGARSSITIDKIEANVEVPDAEFRMPMVSAGATQAPPAAFARGEARAPAEAKGARPGATAGGTPPAGAVPPSGASRATPQRPSTSAATASSQVAPPAPSRPVRFDAATISGLTARNIGSAEMSGRVSAVTAFEEKGRITVFVGAASGGVWKSVNGGSSFTPVFDNQAVQSIGAITIDPGNPRTVWVGTGETWVRNSVSVGDGIYKSTDGGENWTNVGLKDTERISRIIVDPKDGNSVLACATGHLWDDSTAGGVYKTRDAGKTWNKVLAGANPSTGCAMIAGSPQEPATLYAAMWDFRRQAWTFRSGGPGSGLFKSTDGGDHWTELTSANAKGLPGKPYGRIALAVAPSKPQTVYAMIESAKSALFRSDDGGASWTSLDASQYMVWRPFYFAHLIVDPKDPERVFKVDGPLLLSVNGGKSFSSVGNSAHGDFHDVWIDPNNPDIIFTGDDGGLWRSLDGGSRWEHMKNLPISQFYHVSADQADPYRVYGGLQDNSSWVGDSSYPGGVTNARWENMYGGDGFWMWADPSDPGFVYAESQGGEIGRVDRQSHQTRAIKPYARYGEKKLRFNWNTPIQVSPTDKNTLYLGSQFLYRSRDRGQSWERISPDLTTNDPEKQKQEESGGVTVDNSAAEMNTTVYAISESPRNAQTIWVGTDDGNVQVTRDAGKSWTNVTANVQGVGKAPIVSWVEASPHDEAVAFAAFDRHMYGDMKPYVYRTADFGKTWQALPVQEAGVRGYAHVVKQDPQKADLLFVGTEFGLWVSIDGGTRWAQYRGTGFPAVAVRDLVVHPRTSDLVLATHGRGIWIIDDISPWRALTSEVMDQAAGFLPLPGAVQYLQGFGGWAEGDNSFTGPSRPGEALIPYYQRTRHIFGDLKIEVLDEKGEVVDTVASTKHRGVNRAAWSMRLKGPRVPPAASALFAAAIGPRVLPGDYTIRLTKGDQVYTTKMTVVLDPRAPYTVEDRRAQFALVQRLAGLLNHMSWAVDAIAGVREAAMARAAKLGASDPLRQRLAGLADAADALRKQIVATKEGGMITGEERLREFLGGLYGDVNGYDGRPTDEQVARADALGRELDDVVKQFTDLTARQLTPLNRELQAKKLGAIVVPQEKDWK